MTNISKVVLRGILKLLTYFGIIFVIQAFSNSKCELSCNTVTSLVTRH